MEEMNKIKKIQIKIENEESEGFKDEDKEVDFIMNETISLIGKFENPLIKKIKTMKDLIELSPNKFGEYCPNSESFFSCFLRAGYYVPKKYCSQWVFQLIIGEKRLLLKSLVKPISNLKSFIKKAPMHDFLPNLFNKFPKMRRFIYFSQQSGRNNLGEFWPDYDYAIHICSIFAPDWFKKLSNLFK